MSLACCMQGGKGLYTCTKPQFKYIRGRCLHESSVNTVGMVFSVCAAYAYIICVTCHVIDGVLPMMKHVSRWWRLSTTFVSISADECAFLAIAPFRQRLASLSATCLPTSSHGQYSSLLSMLQPNIAGRSFI